MTELAFLPISVLSRMIEAGSVDTIELTQLYLARIGGVGRSLNCFITVCTDTALAEAAASADRARSKRRLGPLDGIPVAVKDNMDVAGVPTSNGFGGAPYRIPDTDSEVVRRLRAAGAIILGKLNLHEGAVGATNDNPHFGRAINPHRAGHSPGGSSGGSGAAVAAGLCCAALGSDTGGSVRIPASYCGVVGLKPSYGLISTRGVVTLSYRLDHVGPLTRTVEDTALMLDVLAGFDPACTESRRGPIGGYGLTKSGRLDGIKLGVLSFPSEEQEAAVSHAFEQAVGHLRDLGAELQPVSPQDYDPIKGRRAGFVRVEAEAAFNHADLYQREPERFSPQMRSYLDYGASLPATKLIRADRLIEAGTFALNRCFDEVDAIVSPATPQAAPAFGGAVPDNPGTYSVLANFAGAPAISVPMGLDEIGRPLGLQIIGPVHQDSRVLEIAAAYEATIGLRLLPPPPFGPPQAS
jgi:Asp-tRNA(Asn)/Glu-tRNA(Gln) amidotransferase A subunit family amidase